MLRGDSLVGQNLCVYNHPSMARLHKEELDLFVGIIAIERHNMEVTLLKYGVCNGESTRVRILKNSLT